MSHIRAKSGRKWRLDWVQGRWVTEGAYLYPGGTDVSASWMLRTEGAPSVHVDLETPNANEAIDLAEEYLP